MRWVVFLSGGLLAVLGIGFILSQLTISLADDSDSIEATNVVVATDVPMQGSELKIFDSCHDFQGMFFVKAGQALEGGDGWGQRTDHANHNFNCSWRQQDIARCQAIGFEVGGDSASCIESTGISHGPGRQHQTRAEAEAAMLNEVLPTMSRPVFIRDPRLELPEYSNVLIAKRPDNSTIDWSFQMFVFTPAEWWMPVGSRVNVDYRLSLPSSSPQTIEAAKRHSPAIPSDDAVVTTFLDMLRPAECIFPATQCVADDWQRTLDGLEDIDEHFQNLQQQSEEAIRSMQERLREMESQLGSESNG